MSSQGVWRQTDADRNGVQDYWTHDVEGLHSFPDSFGRRQDLIRLNLALADACPCTSRFPPRRRPNYGYWFRAMDCDEAGASYRLDPDIASATGYRYRVKAGQVSPLAEP